MSVDFQLFLFLSQTHWKTTTKNPQNYNTGDIQGSEDRQIQFVEGSHKGFIKETEQIKQKLNHLIWRTFRFGLHDSIYGVDVCVFLPIRLKLELIV